MIWRVLAVLALAWALGFALFMLSLGKPLEAYVKTDAIVVPTGGPGRIDRGIALMQAHAAKRMLITGTDPTVRPIELAVEYRAPPRLFRCCIDLGHEAVDTRSNADETAAWVRRRGYKSVRLVTADWHLPRAKLELGNALGGEVEIRGDGVRTNARFAMLLREYHKYLLRRVALLFGLGNG
ncbi:YdcF family protein [Sphingomonas sp.]|uniref:YdcF family protein n=1 Tax=Sphingomonas sp. TaxID=28214 RepID=UPI0031E24816